MELESLTELQELDLGQTELKSVPAEFGYHTNLQRLSLDSNELESIPAEFGYLTELQYLNLGHNKLTNVAPELGHLTKLKLLSLRYNELTSVSPELGNLTQLEYLDLGNNNLGNNKLKASKRLPAELGNLTELQLLDVTYNALKPKNMPREIGNLGKLKNWHFENGNSLTRSDQWDFFPQINCDGSYVPPPAPRAPLPPRVNTLPASAGYEPSIFTFGTSLLDDDASSIAHSNFQEGLTWEGSMQTSSSRRFGSLQNWGQTSKIDLKSFFALGRNYRTTIDDRNKMITFETKLPNENLARVRTHRSNIAVPNNQYYYKESPLWDPIADSLYESRTNKGTFFIQYGPSGWIVRPSTQEQESAAERMSLDGSYVGRPSSIASRSTERGEESTPTPSLYAPSVAESEVPSYYSGAPTYRSNSPSLASSNETILPSYAPYQTGFGSHHRLLPQTPQQQPETNEERRVRLDAEIAEAQEQLDRLHMQDPIVYSPFMRTDASTSRIPPQRR